MSTTVRHPRDDSQADADPTPTLVVVWPVTGPYRGFKPSEVEARALATEAALNLRHVAHELGVETTDVPRINLVLTAADDHAREHPDSAGCKFSIRASVPTRRVA